jgi:excisionase family DNA binding protein
MSELLALPTLDELAADPRRAASLPAEARSRIVLACSAILAAVAANGHGEAVKPEASEFQTLLTIGEAADRSNVPASWVRQAVKDGRLKSKKLGHYRRIHPDDLGTFLTTHPR